MKKFSIILVLILISQMSLAETDKPAPVETAKATEVKQQHYEGQVKWLPGVNKDKFFSLIKDSVITDTKGHILLLHEQNSHPNAPEVVGPLRRLLPDFGWTTLSIEMPDNREPHLKSPADLPKIRQQRVSSGLTFLKQQDGEGSYVVAYGLGVQHALEYILNNSTPGIKGLVMISGYHKGKEFTEEQWKTIKSHRIPILDIYAKHDYPRVLQAVDARSKHYKPKAHPLYRQVEIIGANHAYRHFDEALAKVIRGWLHKLRVERGHIRTSDIKVRSQYI